MVGRRLAGLLWAVCLLMATATLSVLLGTDLVRRMAGDAASAEGVSIGTLAVVAIVLVTVAFASIGLLLARRTESRRIGVVLVGGGLSFGGVAFGYVVGGAMVFADQGSPIANAVFLLGPTMIPVGYALILPIPALLFPYGSLPSPRWRAPSAVVAILLTLATAVNILRPGPIAGTPSLNPLGVEAMPAWMADSVDLLAGVGVLLATLLGLAALITRYHRGGDLLRHQLRWIVTAVSLTALPFALAPQPVIGGPGWSIVASAGLLLVPVSVWVAVTRHGLYRIDRLISRGLAWGALTTLLVAVYASGVLVLQGLLAGVTQGQTLAVAASTLLAAAAFQPLQRRLQRWMDRRFDRARYDGERIAAAFGERLRQQVHLAELDASLTSTVVAALRPAGVGLWVRSNAGSPEVQRPRATGERLP